MACVTLAVSTLAPSSLLLAQSLGPIIPATQTTQQPAPPAPLAAPAPGAPGSISTDSPLLPAPGALQADCPSPVAHITPGSLVSAADWIEVQRTACSATCPVYTVRLYGNGNVHWHGEKNVSVLGDASAQVDGPAATNLMSQLRDYGFAYACNNYTRSADGSATFYTTMSVSGQVKRIRDQADSAPVFLREFDRQVDALADTHRWRHGDPSRELFGQTHLVQDARLPKPGVTPLMQAAAGDNVASAQMILDMNKPVDDADASGWTALMFAAQAGSLEMVNALLDASADATARSKAGETTLFAAASARQAAADKVRRLGSAGANVAATSADGTNALMIAARNFRSPGLIKAMMDLGADPLMRNQAGQTTFDVLDAAEAKDPSPAEYRSARALLIKH